ncbi:hypothetical protein ACQ4PT_033025 [Festuca glaucescens]
MANESESITPPNLYGTNPIRKPRQILPGGRTTLAVILLSTVVFVLVFSNYYPEQIQIVYGLAHTSHQTAITGHEDNGNCKLFNGTWIRDLRGPIYNNMTCPTMPDSKNCGKYGKQMDYVNWRWMPHGCDMARFEPQLFLNIVQGKTLAFAGDSMGRNQMESLLCLLSQVEAPIKVHSDTEDKFITWHFRSHNFTLMALWTKFLVEESQREINGTLLQSHDMHLDKLDARLAANLHEINILVVSGSRWFFRKNYLYEEGKLIGCIYCSEDNITNFSVISVIQRAFRTALSNLDSHQESRLQLTVVRTATTAHFENGDWDTGGTCNRTGPVGEGTAMTGTGELEIRNVQVEEANRAQKENNHKRRMNIEVLDITKAMSMRPDGHPGLHWDNQWMKGYSDCSHWCLPGPIDTWNELLLAVLTKYRKNLEEQ